MLSGVAQVQSRLFEGRLVTRARPLENSGQNANKEIAAEWNALQKRARQTRIVVVDGFEVLAEHLGPSISVSVLHGFGWWGADGRRAAGEARDGAAAEAEATPV